jgi:hypothetical protein
VEGGEDAGLIVDQLQMVETAPADDRIDHHGWREVIFLLWAG